MKRSAVLLVVFALFAGARAADFSCPGAGDFASAPCTGTFYSCGGKGEKPTTQKCPADLVLNEKTGQCDYKSAALGCPVDPSKCPGEGNFPMGNCEPGYYACPALGAEPYEMNCTEGTFFNPINDQCDFKEEVLGCVCTTPLAAAKANANFSTLVAALEATGLDKAVDDAYANITVFAPTDAAFDALLKFLNVTATEALSNKDLVTMILGVHVAEGRYTSKDLTLGLELPSLVKGQDITVTQLTPTVKVAAPGGEAGNVIAADIDACSAVVHVVDRVLLPKLD